MILCCNSVLIITVFSLTSFLSTNAFSRLAITLELGLWLRLKGDKTGIQKELRAMAKVDVELEVKFRVKAVVKAVCS